MKDIVVTLKFTTLLWMLFVSIAGISFGVSMGMWFSFEKIMQNVKKAEFLFFAVEDAIRDSERRNDDLRRKLQKFESERMDQEEVIKERKGKK